MDNILLIILGISTVITVGIPVLLAALAKVRDELFSLGFIDEKSRWGKMSINCQKMPILRVLQEIGFTDEDKSRIKFTRSQKIAFRRQFKKPATLLLTTLKRWTRELEIGFSNPGTGPYYIDTMGSMYFDHNHGPSLSIIMQTWICLLIQNNVIEPFDFVLSQKAGNNILVRQSANRISLDIKTIFAKNAEDKSRVVREDSEYIHITDFEGLEAFLEKKKGTAPNGQKFKGIAIDDNCTSGKSLADAIRHFNEFASVNLDLALQPINTAVVLFTVKSPVTENIFVSNGINLHALLALGEEDMRKIVSLSENELITNTASFKDGFACDESKRLSL